MTTVNSLHVLVFNRLFEVWIWCFPLRLKNWYHVYQTYFVKERKEKKESENWIFCFHFYSMRN